MFLSKLYVGALLAAGIAPGILSATVITFDDLATPEPAYGSENVWGYVPPVYAGLIWSGWQVMNVGSYSFLYNDPTPIPSNPNFAYPGLESELLSVGSGAGFEFVGAELAMWPNTSSPVAQSVTINGYFEGNFVGSTTDDISTAWSPSGGIAGVVDALEFAPNDEYFRMDNFQVQTPEPATLPLFGAGLFVWGAGLLRRTARSRMSRYVIESKEGLST
jgi:hypothetical protein